MTRRRAIILLSIFVAAVLAGRHIFRDPYFGDGRAELVMEVTALPLSAGRVVWNTWTVSPVGRRLAYVAGGDEKERGARSYNWGLIYEMGDHELVVIDGIEQKPYDEILKPLLASEHTEPFYDDVVIFSEDGRHFAYAARLGEKWFVVRDGKEGKAYDGIDEWSIKLSPDGRRLAYVAESAGRKFVVDNGNEGTRYDQIDAPVFSPDGTKMGYVARRKPHPEPFSVINAAEEKLHGNGSTWNMFLRNDGTWVRPDTPKRMSHRPVVSPDGKHVAYAGHKRSVFKLINEKAKALLGRRFLKVRGPNVRIYVDQKPVGPPCRWVAELFFSSDSKHIAAVVLTADGYYAMVDGRLRQPLYDFSTSSGWGCPAPADGRHCHVEVLATKNFDVSGVRITELALVPSEAGADAD